MSPRSKNEKSRKGCQRCKIRRIKCDGLEPECNNCLRRGFQCPGQKPGLRWSSKHEVLMSSSLTRDDVRTPGTSISMKASDESSHRDTAEDLQTRDVSINGFNADAPPAFVDNDSVASSHWNDLSWLNDLDDVLQLNSNLQEPSGRCEGRSISPSPAQCASSTLFRAPLDLPTTLVEYWFSHICPVWSAFDSHANYNRKIPLDTWTSSEPVFYALQAMAAAFLADSMPQMSSLVPSLVTQATTTIQHKVSSIRNAPNIPSINITIDLLFAVFAMGTSTHWADAPELGDKLMQDAREILGLWRLQLTAHDAMVHAYFHQALTWWQMMSSLADREPKNDTLDRKRLQYQMRLRQAINIEDNNIISAPIPETMSSEVVDGGRLHPWCGASSEVIDLFGQCVALCRSSRNRYRNRIKTTLKSRSDALAEIAIARDLQQELLGMDFDVMIAMDELRGISLHTGDEKTPITHLIITAEAYRHASLMQLYLTFEDLEMPQLSPRSATGHIGLCSYETETRQQQLLNMALKLVDILEQIPIDSGSRCIQPPLLILAAAGLKLNKFSSTDCNKDIDRNGAGSLTDSINLPIPPAFALPFSNSMLSIAKARRSVKSRLLALQATLPIKPLRVASDLIDAIWREYDDIRRQGSDESHWLDVMNDTGLKTIFG